MKYQIMFLLSLVSALLCGADETWLNNKLGLEHTVPVPFEKVSADGSQVKIWNRVITLNGAALPEQITSGQEALLTDSAVLYYDDGSKKTTLTPVDGALKMVEKFDDYAVFTGKAVAGNVTAEVRTEIWFDGLTRIKIKTDAPDSVKVKRFSMDLPFNPEAIGPNYVRPFYGYAPHVLRDQWGIIKGKKNLPFLTAFGLSGRNSSFIWIAEYPRTWYLQRRNQVLQIDPTEDVYNFRVNFIDAYGKAKLSGRELEFALMWGPMRPPRKEWRRYHEIWWEAEPNKLKKLNPEMRHMVLWWPFSLKGKGYAKYAGTPYGRASRVSFNIPQPENPEAFSSWLKETKDAGGLVCPYVNADNFDPSQGTGKKYYREWAGKPIPAELVQSNSGFTPGDGFYVCFASKTWADYYVYTLAELFSKWGFDGYYIDNCATHVCQNPEHEECRHYVDELGRKWSKMPYFAARMLYLRIYKEIKKRNPEAVFFTNGSRTLPWWDFLSSNEAVGNVKGFWSDLIKPGEMEGFAWSGRQTGSPTLMFAHGNTTPDKTRDYMALAFLGDSITPWYMGDTSEWEKFANNILVPLKLWEAKFIPYWENQEMVSVSDKNVLPTLYVNKDKALLILSNPWGKTADITVTVNPEHIFGRSGKADIVNAETKEELKSTLKMVYEKSYYDFTVKVGSKDFVLILISLKGSKK